MSLRRVYETTIIINAALEDPEVEVVIDKITSYLENHGSVIEEKNLLGRRRLAYQINKKYNGYYIHLVFNSNPNVIPALERFLTLDETILRHLTLHLSDELREHRKERLLAEGKSVETLISSVTEDIASVKASNRAKAMAANLATKMEAAKEFAKAENPTLTEAEASDLEEFETEEITDSEAENPTLTETTTEVTE